MRDGMEREEAFKQVGRFTEPIQAGLAFAGD